MQNVSKKAILLTGVLAAVVILAAGILSGCNLQSQDPTPDIFGAPDVVVLDGAFGEWDLRTPAYTDPSGDQAAGGLDFGELYIDNDQDYLYLSIELNQETNLQNGSDLVMYVDTDNDPNTGEAYHGLGADLVYQLGNRRGVVYQEGERGELTHDAMGLITMPTVTSERFEMAIERKELPGGGAVFPGERISLAFAHAVDGGDQIPDAGAVIEYTFAKRETTPASSISLEKEDPQHLRIVSWNTLKDGLLKEGRAEHFQPILRAVAPDVINLQELYVSQADDVLAQIEAWFPETEWHVHKMGDLVTISRYPFADPDVGRFPIITGASPVLIELPGDERILIINSHFRCCDQDDLRQREIDELMRLVRDSITPGERVDLRQNTPIVILGDMNLVGFRQQVTSLLTGDIVDEDKFGADFDPDWDGSALTDLLSRHTESYHTYTWRDDQTSFSPGRLDYFIYTDSVLQVVKHYILDTTELSPEKLSQYGLNMENSAEATDHLIMVVDVVIRK